MQIILKQVGNYIIRNCKHTDLIHVVEINVKTLPEHYTDYFYEHLLSELPEAFLVAEIFGSCVGYIMCKTEYGFSNFKKLGFVKKGHIVSISVLENHRKKGIGNIFVHEVINSIKSKKCDELYLEVRCSNNDAVRFYKKIGFVMMHTLKTYYRDGEDAYLMAIELDY